MQATPLIAEKSWQMPLWEMIRSIAEENALQRKPIG